jgi:ferredoxin
MVLLSKRLMEHIGLNPERLRIEFMSSAEGGRFAETVNDFVKKVRSIGPFGQSEGLGESELDLRLKQLMALIPYLKMAKRDKLSFKLKDPEAWDQYFTREEVETFFREFPSYYIDPEKCQACMTCARRCPVEAISGGKNLIHIIDQEKCIKCGTCLEVCPPKFNAVMKWVGQPVPAPIAEEKRTIVRKGKEKES